MTDQISSYDPSVHTVENDQVVSLALYCACGAVFTQIDLVSLCLPQIEDFRSKHSGSGHGYASPQDCLAERELRREAGFRMAGRQSEYKSKKRKAPSEPGFNWAKKGKN